MAAVAFLARGAGIAPWNRHRPTQRATVGHRISEYRERAKQRMAEAGRSSAPGRPSKHSEENSLSFSGNTDTTDTPAKKNHKSKSAVEAREAVVSISSVIWNVSARLKMI